MKEDWRGREKKSDLKKKKIMLTWKFMVVQWILNNFEKSEMTSLIVYMLEYGIQELQVQSYK